MTDKLTLIGKLAAIMAEVERIPKNGTNEFHKYKYVTESDLVDALRGKLAKAGIVIIPSVEKATTHVGAVQTKSGSQSLTDLEMSFTIYDAVSDQKITAKWAGQGADAGDKGIYKAMTGGMKYFLMKTFLVSTGDDPEGEREIHKAATPEPIVVNQPVQMASDEQKQVIVDLMKSLFRPRPKQEWLDTLTAANAEAFGSKLQEEIEKKELEKFNPGI